MNANPADPRPVSVQIADVIRADIDAGVLQPGDQLPPARELAQRFSTTMETVRQAMIRLKNAGLLDSRRGSGVYVRQPEPVRRLARNRLSKPERDAGRGAFLTDAADAGFQPDVQTDIHVAVAGDDNRLGIEPDAEILIRDRIMFADAQPIMLATSRLPRDLTRSTPLELTNPGAGGIYARLEELTGAELSFVETVTARMPTSHEATALQLGPGVPVLEVNRIAYADDRAVETNRMILAGPRYELVYEIG